MQPHAPQTWDRHAILAEIKRRFGSLRALSQSVSYPEARLSLALASPYPDAERVIARALEVPAAQLWPDRYWPNGRRREGHTRPQCWGASQNTLADADRGDGL